MACESCQEGALFPPEAAFGMHGAQNLPRIAARERTAAESCHGKTPGNASGHNLAIARRPINTSMKNLHNRHLTIVYKALTRNQAEYNKEIGF